MLVKFHEKLYLFDNNNRECLSVSDLTLVETGSDLPRTKSWDIPLDCHIRKYRGTIRSKIVFFRISNISVPCPHAQLRGRTVNRKLWTFFGPWGRDRSQSPPCWIFRVKLTHQSTASEKTTWLDFSNYTRRQINLYRMFFADFSVNSQPILMKFCKDYFRVMRRLL